MSVVDALTEHGLDAERAGAEIDKALREGRLQEPMSDRYDPTG